ncbi:hypothetical protein [Natrinema sp. SYSU A 869]|uniref:hypothetical protein n=1 Tax=Natrinema sp. SYSU A 869 TaxID=2871694 RepID=UPI001CA3B1F0|nr:hypothetical protein [Natrinema sp. SYSU A 869]
MSSSALGRRDLLVAASSGCVGLAGCTEAGSSDTEAETTATGYGTAYGNEYGTE